MSGETYDKKVTCPDTKSGPCVGPGAGVPHTEGGPNLLTNPYGFEAPRPVNGASGWVGSAELSRRTSAGRPVGRSRRKQSMDASKHLEDS